MDYKNMLKAAISKGQSSEKVMWESVDAVDSLLESIKEHHPDQYWEFLRDTHESLYGRHYDEEFARHDIENIRYTDRQRIAHLGAHWTADEVESAMSGMQFPTGTTKWDKYVAANVTYSDLCKNFEDAEILRATHSFWFGDEDWPSPSTKIWDYMTMRNDL